MCMIILKNNALANSKSFHKFSNYPCFNNILLTINCKFICKNCCWPEKSQQFLGLGDAFRTFLFSSGSGRAVHKGMFCYSLVR